MSAEIVSFPARATRIYLVVSNSPRADEDQKDSVDYISRKLMDANWMLSGAMAEISDAQLRLLDRSTLEDGCAVMCGETLESVLRAALSLIDTNKASNRDRGIAHELRQWLQVNGSAS